ncbi:hypothetical protein T09_15461 [Trichinella sp. T9]|nr:hypothetical protein T09_15461 [Trichinella sp. T9]
MSMDRFLKPERLDVDHSSPTSSEQWKHWLATFENFLAALPQENSDKKSLLVNFVSPRIYSSIAASRTYEDAIQSLKSIFEKPVNEIYARHLLATRKQLQGESLDEFLRALNALAVACDCKAVTAVQYQEELVRDAFVRGIRSQTIRQRLLESRSVDLASIYELASVLDAALRSSENYNENRSLLETVAAAANDENNDRLSESPGVVAATRNPRCFFCGRSKHPRFQCPAREATCNKCGKKGHYAKVCRSSVSPSTTASLSTITGATLASVGSTFPHSLAKAVVKILLCGKEINCLIDTGSSESFIHPEIVKRLGLKTIQSSEPVSMASSALSIKALGCITVDLKVQDRLYKSFRLRVLPHLCADVILGQDFHRMHESVTLNYGGNLPPLIICGLATLRVDPPRLFAHLSPDCRPIATTSRKFSAEDTNFIRNEVRTLLEDGVIEPSISPWRAQVVVLKDERRKKRLDAFGKEKEDRRHLKADREPINVQIFPQSDTGSRIVEVDDDEHKSDDDKTALLWHLMASLVPSFIVPKKLKYYTTTKNLTEFFVEAFTTILSAKKLESDDVLKICLSLFGQMAQVDLSKFYFELCRDPEVVLLNKQQIEELKDDYMPPKLDEMSRLLNGALCLLTIGKKIDIQFCVEWMTARAKAIYSILDVPWNDKALDKVIIPERLKVLSDASGRAQRMRCAICMFIIHMSKSMICEQPIYKYVADMLEYSQLIGFYLIYYILVCDTGHPVMKDSYLTMDTMKFIEAYDVWNQYPKCYRKYMGLMADKDTLSLMGGNCLRRLTYIAIQIAARRDPSIKNLKFVLQPDSEPLLQENEEKTTLRRSQRIRRPPQRLDL